MVLEETVYTYVFDEVETFKWSWQQILQILYYYDQNGAPLGMRLQNNAGEDTVYYYRKNLQVDVLGVLTEDGYEVVTYTYDAWGRVRSTTSAATSVNVTATDKANMRYNPFRYRGYYFDTESSFYYLQSRYYNPGWGRFLNADSYINANGDLLGYNMFAYCSNNPVTRTDETGTAWETVFDVASLVFSIGDVASNPSDRWAWIGLVGDIVDLIPFIAGVGEVTRAIKTGRRIADTAENLHGVAKVTKKAPIVIGENMKRVKKYAAEIGGDVYKPWKNDPFDFTGGNTGNEVEVSATDWWDLLA